VLGATGGVCELVGLVLVAKDIADDRRQARRLFAPRQRRTRPRRRYPPKAGPRSPTQSPVDSMRPASQQQDALRKAIANIEVSVYNALIEMRKSLDAQHDEAVEQLGTEILKSDNEIRGHLRYVLAGSIRSRVIGAAVLGAGILFEIAGAILSAT
jgi:hypothetical protein